MTQISPDRIRAIEARRDELQALMSTGDLPSDRFVAVSKEYAELEPVAQAACPLSSSRSMATATLANAARVASVPGARGGASAVTGRAGLRPSRRRRSG